MRLAIFLLLAAASASAQQWNIQTNGTDTNLRGISAVYSSGAHRHAVVWACGSKGVILRSDDGGKSWKHLRVPGADTLDFRGIVAFADGAAYVMSIGSGDQSRIYKTADNGATWKLEYSDARAAFFLDALACVSEKRCIALSDPVDGKFLLLSTEDGDHWRELPRDAMPPALPKEGVFAASNSALIIHNNREIYFATGGTRAARVFHSPDFGRAWTASETPIAVGNDSSGIFSLARSGGSVVVVGGDYKNVNGATGVAAFSSDRGATWKLAAHQPGGFRSGVAVAGKKTFVSVGPAGGDVSRDGGKTWTESGALNMNAVAALGGEIWAAGAHGTVARLSYPAKSP
ncbi:MAG TPA: hypothetical protein VJN21_13970 [Candidatus Acidoferrales bacterium]|nr:hypothetical protein [Candidatus Acidoferrales bacterium]